MTYSPSVCVLIPVYRLPLSASERVSLQQCMKILGHHPICVIKPASLNISALLAEFPQLAVENFSDADFSSIAAYNRLMLSAAFYERFSAFEYILVHQLDAFVFRDELARWCAADYDYIGAPWLSKQMLMSRVAALRARARRWLSDSFDRRARDGYAIHPARNFFRVGNGGFTLRRIAALLTVIDSYAAQISAGLSDTFRPINEDQLLCIVINRTGSALRTPDYRIASRFAVELAPKACIEQLNGGALPFGCHAWQRYEPDFWLRHITACGYSWTGDTA